MRWRIYVPATAIPSRHMTETVLVETVLLFFIE